MKEDNITKSINIYKWHWPSTNIVFIGSGFNPKSMGIYMVFSNKEAEKSIDNGHTLHSTCRNKDIFLNKYM